ncbi:MAG: anaerobic glycerol-3-phosphate dehydrogenase subunit A [Muribaculaceae bacterium]|nr:anaerobic glycerol-3-phosphate dehydrogenase subunit A [Muribaculaceae bacterium]
MDDNNKQYDVIVIGGGITGAGVARDCARRGLSVLLLERLDYTNGASGRNHGLMHSGARYAVTDRESAAECISENMILRRIARHCVEETDGLFITLPEDDLAYQQTFAEACRAAGIRADIIDPAQARALEPAVNPDLIGAVRVPDAAIDPFRLTMANVVDAQLHGADALTYHEVTALIVNQNRVEGVRARDLRTGAEREFRATVTINAAGIWGMLIARMAGVTINMFPAKGAMLIFGHRVNKMVINRCRKPANADILVPDATVSIVGTTSDRVPIDTVDDMRVTGDEVRVLLAGAQRIAPVLASTRILRAYAGVRPLVAADNDPAGRSISRGIVCLDHEQRDGMAGLITITGGKMMTYRLMAQIATDLACRKLGNTTPCDTASVPLPGSGQPQQENVRHTVAFNAAKGRHGTWTERISLDTEDDRAMVCECEGVSVGELRYALENLNVHTLTDLRRSTRLGMGVCQGRLCACRAATLLGRINNNILRAQADLARLLDERWKGMKPIAWGATLREAQLTATIYQGLCGLDKAIARKEDEQ